MIIVNSPPSKKIVKSITKNGDDTFGRQIPDLDSFLEDKSCPIYIINHYFGHSIDLLKESVSVSGICLKMKGNVNSHCDPYTGLGGEPKDRLAAFWLISHKKPKIIQSDKIELYANGDFREIKVGDCVIFDDSKVHALLIQGTWTGITFQFFKSL